MKKSLSLFVMLLTMSIISAHQVNACTVAPLNPVEQKNDLIAKALTKMNISIENVTSVEVEDYAGDYLWTPMCPKGLNSKATFTISFNNDPSTKGCTAVVKVAKNLIYKKGEAKYSYDFVQTATCLE